MPIGTTFTEAALRRRFDIAIRREVPGSGQYQTWPPFRESNTVIASPALILRSGVKTVEQLSNETWLTSETRPGDWEAWVKATGMPHASSQSYVTVRSFFCDFASR
ncbi:LysR substrate-binding domain-containing protein [Burkholderia sp. Leaf177]|uniref:LysR substrate-binding domain-containing protein n=1 Tax=Burkholderia sp. Leaf177 TaxID=1736287 RepID=UPI000A99E6A3